MKLMKKTLLAACAAYPGANNARRITFEYVMLKGVNDSVEAQVALSEALFDAGILPYYFHVLDKVQGAAHYFISDEEAKAIMRGLITRVSGYLVPKLTREIGGRPSKTPLDLHLE